MAAGFGVPTHSRFKVDSLAWHAVQRWGMAHIEPTTQDVLDELRAFREATEKRFDGIERKVDDLTELVQATATGNAKRFGAIERRLDGQKPLSLV